MVNWDLSLSIHKLRPKFNKRNPNIELLDLFNNIGVEVKYKTKKYNMYPKEHNQNYSLLNIDPEKGRIVRKNNIPTKLGKGINH